MVQRRSLIHAALVTPAAGVIGPMLTGDAAGAAGPSAAAGESGGRFDAESPRFAIAVLPDTQYLFDQDSSDPAPLTATFRYLLRQRADANIAFMTHLGDVTEHGSDHEIALADRCFRAIDGHLPYSVLAGNHDVPSRTDDQRGVTAYQKAFGPQRFAADPTFGGASPDGYNSYHLLRAGGRRAAGWHPPSAVRVTFP
jgi:3',5'-cyclic AMP phosphodiesterase CpdA